LEPDGHDDGVFTTAEYAETGRRTKAAGAVARAEPTIAVLLRKPRRLVRCSRN
jgi:hypothetical protein